MLIIFINKNDTLYRHLISIFQCVVSSHFLHPLPVVFLVRVHDNAVVVDDVGKGHGARHDLEDGGHARPRGEHVLSLPAVVGPRGGLDHGIGGFVATAQPRHKLGQLHFGEFGVLGPIIS